MVNPCNASWSYRIGYSYVCATETSDEPDLNTDCVPFPNPSGGWFQDLMLEGLYVWLYRNGPALESAPNNYYTHELGLFGMIN